MFGFLVHTLNRDAAGSLWDCVYDRVLCICICFPQDLNTLFTNLLCLLMYVQV